MKKNIFAGVFEICLSCVIFCLGLFFYNLGARQNEHSSALLKEQKKQAKLYEQSTIAMKQAVAPLRNGIDQIVKLRDYTVWNKKPFYHLGNAFVELQKSVQNTYDSLEAARSSFRKVGEISLEQEKRNNDKMLFCFVGFFLCIGLGFLVNGIYLCLRKENTPSAAQRSGQHAGEP